MSTQIRFDLAGLQRAIEECDARYRLALYADNAEVHLVDYNPDRSPHILQGKAAIASWLQERYASNMSHHVVDPVLIGDHVALTEQCRSADGASVIYACDAEVCAGQITRETVRLAWEDCILD